MNLKSLLIALCFLCIISNARAVEINISDLGAKPDAIKDNTVIIQKAINDCENAGGGTVIIPTGVFMSGQLFLKSNVTIHLQKNGILRAIPEIDNWTAEKSTRKALITAIDIENASITGEGSLDGNGCLPKHQTGDNTQGRHYTLLFQNCKKMSVSDISLINSCFWTFRILDSDNVIVKGIRIYSHCNLNNDGIDIDGRNIIVSDANIDCVDDAICLKSDSKTSVCENISISNCIISTNCNGIKFGTASNMGFRNVTISNIVIKRPSENNFHEFKIQRYTGLTGETSVNVGLALQMVDGGIMDQINISNIVMRDVQTPFMIKFGNRRNKPQYARNISISNIMATGVSLMTSSVTGFPDNLVENVKISNIILTGPGGGKQDHSLLEIPENEKAYPDNRQFGLVMPCYGLFIRHVKNISIDNIQFNLPVPDYRHAIFIEDAENINLNRVISADHSDRVAYMKIKNVKNATIEGFSTGKPIDVFLKSEGNLANVKLINNDFSSVRKVTEMAADINDSGIIQLNNIK